MKFNNVDTQGVDFAQIGGLAGLLPVGSQPRSSLGGDILRTVASDPNTLQMILGFIFGLISQLAAKKPSAPPVTPVEPAPPVVTEPAPPPPPPPVQVGQRKIATARAKWFFFEEMTRKGTDTTFGERKISPKSRFDDILGGAELGLGARLHIDVTPFDQSGLAFQSGDPDSARLLLTDASRGPVEGNNRIQHHLLIDGRDYESGDVNTGVNWDGQDVAGLSSEYDDMACTPVLTIAQDLPLSVERKIAYYAVIFPADGSAPIRTNTLPVLRIKPWQLPT